MDTTIYTPQMIADRWYITYPTVLRMIREGKLRAFRAGREWRISAEALHEYEARQALTPTRQKRQRTTRIK